MKAAIGRYGLAMTLALTAGVAMAQDKIVMGMSAPLSGAAASWGVGFDWAAQQAAKDINGAGGIKVGGKAYQVEIRTLDNKYTAGDGTKVAQTLISRDGVKFIAGSLGTAPVKAAQALTEREGVLLLNTAWGRSVKGPEFPLSFTQINTPEEVFGLLYATVVKRHPEAKTVAIINPNDATGQETEKDARKHWEAAGVKVGGSHWFERSSTEFQPIATKIAQQKPDIIDLSGTPPANAGVILKELDVQGWKGVKVLAAGTGSDALVKTGGAAANGVYMGLAADFDGATATERQRKLNADAKKEIGEALNAIHIGGYDGVMAIKAGIEAAGSLDARVVAAKLPTIVFDISYGKAAFGGKETYGIAQQLLVPAIITQIQDGKTVELTRVTPPELSKRLAGG